ncbi:hypothetical protein ACSSWA_07420 [Melioribacter sp. Ez-97]|uniref:hypothetical protein n=1 Tax=Melioribacter sp. Ez-97 TaxID=3423434 RepID=UPI003EDA8331
MKFLHGDVRKSLSKYNGVAFHPSAANSITDSKSGSKISMCVINTVINYCNLNPGISC